MPACRDSGEPIAKGLWMTQPLKRSADPVELVPLEGYTHISVVHQLPEVLRGFGVDPGEALEAAGVGTDIFDDPRNTIEYRQLQQLLAACERLTRCDYITMLIVQHTRLADYGIVGQTALCAATAGEGLSRFVRHFNLHSTATTASLLGAGNLCRFVYTISVGGIVDASQFHLGAVTAAFNILQDLFGRQWLPTAVTFATHAPSELRPFHRFFRAPLRFDSEESAVIFERHRLDRALPPVDPAWRLQVEAEIRARHAALIADLPATVRRLLHRQLLIGTTGMDDVAAQLGMHRRTLDRHLRRHGVHYGELLESVKADVARQLLRSTRMHVQQVAARLQYSSAANFATAFHRWTGITPTEYRRRR
jgi:AraC-like DNA-binding protein